MSGTKTGHHRDSPENGTPHDRDMDRDIGGLPPEGGPPCPVRSCPVPEPVAMRLELRSRREDWIDVKATLPAPPGLRKRSYWLGWSEREQRFAKGKEYAAINKRNPMALETVRQRIAAGDFDPVLGQ